jgi:DNA-binding XRE family transcriptional regulator
MASKEAVDFGRRVKDFRLDRQMEQLQAAVFFGISKATLCRIEAGKGCGDLNRVKIEKILAHHQVAA